MVPRHVHVITGFGTSSPDAYQDTYGRYYEEIRAALDCPCLQTVSSRRMQAALANRVPFLGDILPGLEGGEVTVQALFMDDGREYDTVAKLIRVAREDGLSCRMSAPILKEQPSRVAEILMESHPERENHAYLLVTHGGPDGAGQGAKHLESIIREAGRGDMQLYTLQDFHSGRVFEELMKLKMKAVSTVPLMLTDGHHLREIRESLREHGDGMGLTLMETGSGLLREAWFRAMLLKMAREMT